MSGWKARPTLVKRSIGRRSISLYWEQVYPHSMRFASRYHSIGGLSGFYSSAVIARQNGPQILSSDLTKSRSTTIFFGCGFSQTPK